MLLPGRFMKGGDILSDKGLQRTYGRGAGERQYHHIPMPKFRPRPSRLYDIAHAPYPQSGAYATDEEEVKTDGADLALQKDEPQH